jgi:hypothetical protein
MGNIFQQADQAVNSVENGLANGIQASSRMMEEVLRSHPQDVVGKAAEDGIKDGALYMSNLWHTGEDDFSKGVQAVETGVDNGLHTAGNDIASGAKAVGEGVETVGKDIASGAQAVGEGVETAGKDVVKGAGVVAGAVENRVESDVDDISKHPGDSMLLADPASAIVPVADQGTALREGIHLAGDAVNATEQGAIDLGQDIYNGYNSVTGDIHNGFDDAIRGLGVVAGTIDNGYQDVTGAIGNGYDDAVRGAGVVANGVDSGYNDVTGAIGDGYNDAARGAGVVANGVDNGFDDTVRGIGVVAGAVDHEIDSLVEGLANGVDETEQDFQQGYDSTQTGNGSAGAQDAAASSDAQDDSSPQDDIWSDITNPNWW